VGSLREALAVALDTGNKARELGARKFLGVLITDPQASRREHGRALVLARDLNDAPAEADALLGLALHALALRSWDDARGFLQDGLALCHRLKDPVGAAWFWREIGVLQIFTGALAQAQESLDTAMQVFVCEHIQDGVAATHHALGGLALTKGNNDTARREFAIAAKLGLPATEGTRVINVARRRHPQRSWHPAS
jgi:hypothetical protein